MSTLFEDTITLVDGKLRDFMEEQVCYMRKAVEVQDC